MLAQPEIDGFTLGQEMDQNAAKAKYSDGVLELTLPKKQGTAAKEISVS
jgi:HSP20 family protein